MCELLDNPAHGAPSGPEQDFSKDVISIAKRGRRCTAETAVLGCHATQKAIRNHERRDRRYGNEEVEIGRFREYTDAVTAYKRTMRRLLRRRWKHGLHGVWRQARKLLCAVQYIVVYD